MQTIRTGSTLVIGLILAACATGAPRGGSVASPASPSPASTAAASDATSSAAASVPPRELIVGGERPATVYLPPDSNAGPAPLIVMLHGFGSSGTEHDGYFQVGAIALDRGMLYVHPEGTRDSDGNRFWNATDACCDFGGTGTDDAAYLAGMIAEIGTVVDVDPNRVYLIGHSNGGFMSYRMACEHADLITSIVSLAGASYASESACRPSEPVTILEIHGEADDVIRFDGGRLSGFSGATDVEPYPGVDDTIAAWANYDACAPELVEATTTVDVDRRIDGPAGAAESIVTRSADCDPGGHVELWTIPDGSHVPDLSATFAASVLDFLAAHPRS